MNEAFTSTTRPPIATPSPTPPPLPTVSPTLSLQLVGEWPPETSVAAPSLSPATKKDAHLLGVDLPFFDGKDMNALIAYGALAAVVLLFLFCCGCCICIKCFCCKKKKRGLSPNKVQNLEAIIDRAVAKSVAFQTQKVQSVQTKEPDKAATAKKEPKREHSKKDHHHSERRNDHQQSSHHQQHRHHHHHHHHNKKEPKRSSPPKQRNSKKPSLPSKRDGTAHRHHDRHSKPPKKIRHAKSRQVLKHSKADPTAAQQLRRSAHPQAHRVPAQQELSVVESVEIGSVEDDAPSTHHEDCEGREGRGIHSPGRSRRGKRCDVKYGAVSKIEDDHGAESDDEEELHHLWGDDHDDEEEDEVVIVIYKRPPPPPNTPIAPVVIKCVKADRPPAAVQKAINKPYRPPAAVPNQVVINAVDPMPPKHSAPPSSLEHLSIEEARALKGPNVESLVSNRDFESLFGMKKAAFYALPKQQQTDMLKV